jgi:hypothetical protein
LIKRRDKVAAVIVVSVEAVTNERTHRKQWVKNEIRAKYDKSAG